MWSTDPSKRKAQAREMMESKKILTEVKRKCIAEMEALRQRYIERSRERERIRNQAAMDSTSADLEESEEDDLEQVQEENSKKRKAPSNNSAETAPKPKGILQEMTELARVAMEEMERLNPPPYHCNTKTAPTLKDLHFMMGKKFPESMPSPPQLKSTPTPAGADHGDDGKEAAELRKKTERTTELDQQTNSKPEENQKKGKPFRYLPECLRNPEKQRKLMESFVAMAGKIRRMKRDDNEDLEACNPAPSDDAEAKPRKRK